MQAGGDRRNAPASDGATAHDRGVVEPPTARHDGSSIAPLLEAIFANSSEAIVIISEQGDVAFTTTGLAMLLGHDAEAAVGRSVFEFVHPDDLEQAADLFERRLEFTGSDLGYELRLRHSSGDWRAMVVTAAVLPDPVAGSIALTIRSAEASGEIERALRQRVAIGEYSNRLAAEFMGLSEADDVIACVEDSLGEIAFLTGADVVDLVLEHRDRNGVERQARWSQPGLGEIVPSAATPDPAGYGALLSRVVLVDDPEGLPDVVMLPDDRVPVSLLSAPLLGGQRRGCLRAMRVVPGSPWNDADVELVRTVAGIFGRALRTARSEQLLSLTYSEGPIGFSVRTWQGALVDCNERYLELYQLTRDEAERRTPADLLRPAHRFEVIDQLGKLRRGEIDSATSEIEVERGDGHCFWVRTHTVPLQIPGTSEQLILTSVEDVTETHTQRLELEHAARHDSLTGVANRQALGEFVDRSVSTNGRLPTLITIDLDRFKTVNDSHGHLVGDVVLRLSAERIVAQVRPSDLVARLGGDEFAIVVPDSDRDEVDQFCKRLLSSFDAPFDVDGLTVFQQMSIGVAPGASSSDPVDLLVKCRPRAVRRQTARSPLSCHLRRFVARTGHAAAHSRA